MNERETGRWSDRRVESAMGTLLRVGVLVAAALVAAGGLLLLLQQWHVRDTYGTFVGVESILRSPLGIVRHALTFDPVALIALGLMVLVLTPVARVAFALLAFVRQHDLLYVVFSAVVLTVLFLGLSGHTL